VGIYAGGGLVKSGLERRAEANIHSLALEELGQSLEAEITPQVIELEDRTGSALWYDRRSIQPMA
jgi:hypothetical protein